MHIDLRFSVLSFFLMWAALLLTMLTGLVWIRGLPWYQTIVLGVAALALWTAGTIAAL